MPREQKEYLAIVNRYFTPFALALVAAALAVSRPPKAYAVTCVGVLGFAAAFNWLTARFARDASKYPYMRELRLGVNLTMDAFLVFLLLSLWRPIWLLFLLAPIATGVYEDRRKTMEMSGCMAALLLWAYWVCGQKTIYDYSEGAAYATFIVVVSLFVNRVAHAD